MNIDATIRAILGIACQSPLDLVTPEARHAINLSVAFTTGVGLNQVNECFSDSRNLANNTSENLDLAGSLTNPFGVTVAFARIKLIYVRNKSTTQTLTVGGAASNGFTTPFGGTDDTIKIPPGGFILLVGPDATGWAVTASTGDQLKIANGSAGAATDYDIVLLGGLS